MCEAAGVTERITVLEPAAYEHSTDSHCMDKCLSCQLDNHGGKQVTSLEWNPIRTGESWSQNDSASNTKKAAQPHCSVCRSSDNLLWRTVTLFPVPASIFVDLYLSDSL